MTNKIKALIEAGKNLPPCEFIDDGCDVITTDAIVSFNKDGLPSKTPYNGEPWWVGSNGGVKKEARPFIASALNAREDIERMLAENAELRASLSRYENFTVSTAEIDTLKAQLAEAVGALEYLSHNCPDNYPAWKQQARNALKKIKEQG